MNISLNGIALIKGEEGFVPHVYTDIAGFKTIGYGHKLLAGESFPDGITEEDAVNLLLNDLHITEAYLNNHYPSLNQNQYDALCDFAFNLGIGSLEMLLSHGIDQVPTQIMLWDHVNHQVNAGLLRRRTSELNLWNTPVSS